MADQFSISVLFKLIDQLSAPMKKIQGRFTELGKKMGQVGRSMSLKVTLPILGLATAATKASIGFESAFTGVIKTVTATELELANLKAGFMALALEIPVSTNELFGVGEAAGQLGIEVPNILSFTKVMADLGATTNLSSIEAAQGLAQFANVTKMSQKDFDRLGATIVDLGNNLATDEAKIVGFAQRLAGAGSIVGLTEAQILGLGGALASVGIEAEAGGTAFSQVMIRISKEIGSGSKKMQGFAKVAGVSVAEFEKRWKEDAGEALITVVEGLGRLDKEGVNVARVLDALGLEGMRVTDALLRASGSGDKFRGALERGTKAWAANNALTREANLRYATSAARLQIMWNRIKQVAAAFGDVMVPVILEVVDALKPLAIWLQNLSPATKKVIIVVGLLVAAIGPLLILLGGISLAVGAISVPVLMAVGAITALIAGVTALTVKWEKFIEFAKLIKQAFDHFIIGPIKEVLGWVDKAAKFFGREGGLALGEVPGDTARDTVDPSEYAVKQTWFDKIAKAFSDKPEWATAGGAAAAGPAMVAASTMRHEIEGGKTEADIKIKVTSDPGSQATIEDVKKKGDANVQVDSIGYVGVDF